MARHLNIKYVWIDSLCILQDDPIDWTQESSRMASIYGNSYLTISAMWARNSEMGLFSHRDSKLRDTVKIIKPVIDGKELRVYVRKSLANSNDWLRPTGLKRDDAGTRALYPLWYRAWTLQEHLMAPRSLIFGPHEVIWECRAINVARSIPNGCGGAGFKEEFWSAFTLGLSAWSMIVSLYCSRNLTFEGDKLPALSGIAKEYQKVTKHRYLAGLWSGNLLSDLQWESSDSQFSYRPAEYRAPLWSWAAIEGPVRFVGKSTPSHVEILDAFCSQNTSDPTGAVTSGYIKLRASIVPATYLRKIREWDFDSMLELDKYSCKIGRFYCYLNPDVPPEKEGKDHIAEGDTLYCVQLTELSVGEQFVKMLSLRVRDTRPDEFERVGMMELFLTKAEPLFEDIKPTLLTIF